MNREHTKRRIETLQEQLEVEQYYVDGGEVECGTMTGWVETTDPTWNWNNNNFRKVEGPTYRPYTMEEMHERCSLWIRTTEKCHYMIIAILDDGVRIARDDGMILVFWNELLEYKWVDSGKPCGVEL